MLRPLLFVMVGLCLGTGLWADPVLRLEPVASGLTQPLLVTHAGDGSGRLFIVQKDGVIRVLQNGQLQAVPYLDLRARVTNQSEMGLLGLAFHPEFRQNGRLFVNYATDVGGPRRTVIAEFRAPSGGQVAEPASERIILSFDQPAANHNGGMLAFGPDGYLYISSGDGGGANDVFGNGQNLTTLLGGILRIDVDRDEPYVVPPDNPLAGVPGVRPELWAWGLRNPWRMSFDRLTGLLFVGDVGQGSREEINLVRRAGNYGWNRMEGSLCFPIGSQCDSRNLLLPIAEYGRAEGVSVTGGYVYRGLQRTELWGSYFFGDFGSGRIWSLTPQPGGTWKRHLHLETGLSLSSFGEDEQGELYAVGLGGTVHRLVFGWRERFAHFADGQADQGRLRSELVLASGEDRTISGIVRFRDREGMARPVAIGGSLTAELPFELAPRETLILETDATSDPVYVGWAEAEADGHFNGTVLFRFESAADGNLSEAGIAASEPGAQFAARVYRSLAEGVDTGFAVANPNSFPVTVRAGFFQEGLEVARSELRLEAGAQRAAFASELAGLEPEFSGTLRVAADAEVVVTLLRTQFGLPLASLPAGK